MKLKNIFSLLLVVAFAATSCDDFEDLNVDPNEPSSAPNSTLLTGVFTGSDDELGIDDLLGANIPVLYVQHLSETQYTESSRYNTVQFNFNGWYTGPLVTLNQIIESNTNEATSAAAAAYGSNNNQIAVARILRAYIFHVLTDRWGALPYSEALQGATDFSPAYDSQEDIYTGLLTELNEATAQMDGGAGPAGDILFSGNMASWAQFANTLRATIAMRMSGVAATTARAEFEDAVSDGLITSDVMYAFLAETNHQNPWYGRFITRTDYAISETLVDYMSAVNDPRLPAFAEPALETGTYVGMPYGIIDAGDITNSAVSFITSDIISTQDAPLAIFTVAQTEFMLAEAALNGWNVSGTAQSHYEAAIQASMEQWGVYDATAYAAYIADPGVAYNAANAMQLIGEQKWVALYLQGYEAWSEWRRTGYPALTPAPDAVNNSGEIPVRQGYPSSEADLNSENYEAAVQMNGADGLDTRLWWDMN